MACKRPAVGGVVNLRAAMVGWEFPPFSSGGLGVHCRYLTEELARQGVELTFLLPPTRAEINVPWMECVRVSSMNSMSLADFLLLNSYAQASALHYKVVNGRIEFSLVLDRAYGKDFFHAVEAYNKAAAITLVELHERKNFQAIHVHDWITLQAGLEAKRATGLPLVVTLHSTEFDRSACLNPTPWVVELEKRGVREADAVIAVSNTMKEQIVQELGAPAEKVHVVHNATPPLPRPRGKRSTRFKWKKVVLCHGRLSIQKGADYFLRAARKLSASHDDVLFVVSGSGPFLPALVELATDLGIEEKVMFLGTVPQDHLSTLYDSCDVLVMPSVREPFGITALEAMSFGKPVVCSKTAGVREIGSVFTTDFWDVDKMAGLVASLLQDDGLRRKAGEASAATALAQKWSDRAADTAAVYRKVIANG